MKRKVMSGAEYTERLRAEEIKKQQKCSEFVASEVYCCQSLLVADLLAKEIFGYDDIQNLYEEVDGESQPREIYEWWIVSDRLLHFLKQNNEPVLENDFGSWWGRTTTGQAIAIDYVIEKIVKELKY